ADFIGEANFLEGRIKSLSANEACVYIPVWDIELFALPVSQGLGDGAKGGGSIRPEKIHITEKPLKEDTLTGEVVNTVYIGTDTHVFVNVRGKKLKIFEQNRISRLDPGSFYTIGQAVTVVMMPENVLVLKKD